MSIGQKEGNGDFLGNNGDETRKGFARSARFARGRAVGGRGGSEIPVGVGEQEGAEGAKVQKFLSGGIGAAAAGFLVGVEGSGDVAGGFGDGQQGKGVDAQGGAGGLLAVHPRGEGDKALVGFGQGDFNDVGGGVLWIGHGGGKVQKFPLGWGNIRERGERRFRNSGGEE